MVFARCGLLLCRDDCDIGYGDLSPHTTLGKLFTIGYIVSGIGIFVAAITALAHATLQADLALGQSDRSSPTSHTLSAECERGDAASHPDIEVRSDRPS